MRSRCPSRRHRTFVFAPMARAAPARASPARASPARASQGLRLHNWPVRLHAFTRPALAASGAALANPRPCAVGSTSLFCALSRGRCRFTAHALPSGGRSGPMPYRSMSEYRAPSGCNRLCTRESDVTGHDMASEVSTCRARRRSAPRRPRAIVMCP